MEFIINCSHIKNKENLHEEIQKKLGFPDYYGRNLDALWDMMTGFMDLPITLLFKNVGKTPLEVQKEITSIKKFEKENDLIRVIINN